MLPWSGVLIRKFVKFGHSIAITIPKPLTELLNIEPGTPVEITVQDGALVLRPMPPSDQNWRGKIRDE